MPKKKTKVKRKIPLNNLKKKADKLFSEYIRRIYGQPGDYVACYTCRRKFHWKNVDAGHYISRTFMWTRYDYRNVKPQCKSCNRFHEGRKDDFALHLIEEYGSDVLDKLNVQKNIKLKFPRERLLSLIEVYKQKLGELK